MSSSLPTESTIDSTVDQFGLGTYDSKDPDEEPDLEPKKHTLPDDGGPTDLGLESPRRYSSIFDSGLMEYHVASVMLPGDLDAPVSHKHDNTDTIRSPLTTVGESQLPWVSKNEVLLKDFWSAFGHTIDDVSNTEGFPASVNPQSQDSEGGGLVLASNNHDSLCEILSSYDSYRITIGSLVDKLIGTDTETKAMSGKTIGSFVDSLASDDKFDIHEKNAKKEIKEAKRAKEERHKFMDRKNREDREDRQNSELQLRSHKATNLELVGELADGVLKKYGKKDLAKRHILAYLQSNGYPQFLSSDIIRCLKHRNKVYIKDVLDEFPVAKKANSDFGKKSLLEKIVEMIEDFNEEDMTEDEFAQYLIEELAEHKKQNQGNKISSIRDALIALEIRHMRNPEVSSVFRRTAAALTMVEVDLEKFEVHNG